MKNILLILWLAMNAFTFCLYGIDKYKAKHGAWAHSRKDAAHVHMAFGAA